MNPWLRRLGAPGVIGLGVLLACLGFHFLALAPAERELGARREAGERLRTRTPFQPASVDQRVQDLHRFYALFPPLERLPDELDRLYGLARKAQLQLLQGEYRLESSQNGLASYRVTLPVRGTYVQLRSFVNAVLTQMPIASVDGLRFERRKAADPQLEAQIRVTVHLQVSKEQP